MNYLVCLGGISVDKKSRDKNANEAKLGFTTAFQGRATLRFYRFIEVDRLDYLFVSIQYIPQTHKH